MKTQAFVQLPQWQTVLEGQSVEGEPLQFLLPSTEKPSPRPINTLIMAAFHGDEPESVDLLQAWMLAHALSDQLEQMPLAGVVPIVNPDGLYRKQRVNARGVDLNRNFPTKNWTLEGEGTPYYPGPEPASEPETQWLIKLLADYPPQKIISIHTPYRVINYDGPAEALARCMAQQNHYEVVSDIGYATPGSFGTYMGKERQIPIITLELSEGPAFTKEELETNCQALTAALTFNLT